MTQDPTNQPLLDRIEALEAAVEKSSQTSQWGTVYVIIFISANLLLSIGALATN